MRIDCNATTKTYGEGAQKFKQLDHRCGLEPGHNTEFHLCKGCRHSWPNGDYRLVEPTA